MGHCKRNKKMILKNPDYTDPEDKRFSAELREVSADNLKAYERLVAAVEERARTDPEFRDLEAPLRKLGEDLARTEELSKGPFDFSPENMRRAEGILGETQKLLDEENPPEENKNDRQKRRS